MTSKKHEYSKWCIVSNGAIPTAEELGKLTDFESIAQAHARVTQERTLDDLYSKILNLKKEIKVLKIRRKNFVFSALLLQVLGLAMVGYSEHFAKFD